MIGALSANKIARILIICYFIVQLLQSYRHTYLRFMELDGGVPIGSSVYYALMLNEETSMENNFILPIGRLKSQFVRPLFYWMSLYRYRHSNLS